jgi:dTDP-L-rhamnose 4-epimerase
VRVLVTGGAGFIGSHVVDQLAGAGHAVVVLDSLAASAHGSKPDYLRHDVEYVWADVCDGQAVEHAVDGVDAVSHQAARVGLGLDFGDVVSYVTDNDLGTAVLLRSLHRSGFGGRFVLASSMVVYGEGAYECARHGSVRATPREVSDLEAGRFEPACPSCGQVLVPVPVSEDSASDPRNVYAATKLHQEHLVAAFGREHGLPATALRYHNVYGPRMPRRSPYAGVASIFRSALADGRPPTVFEDGGQLRDFVHVDDVARANVAALVEDEPVDGAVNVCSGVRHTVLDLAAELARAAGGPEPMVTGGFRLGDVRHVFASPARAEERLGFVATTTFADGVRQFAGAALREPAEEEVCRG